MCNKPGKALPLAQFKRDVAAGIISLEMISWYGKTGDEIPKRLQGVRRAIRSNSVAIFLERNDGGGESELQLKRAALVKYTGSELAVFAPLERDPNDQEKAVLEGWKVKEKELTEKNPWSDLFWQKKDYFAKSTCPYMSGFVSLGGSARSYNPSTGKVCDRNLPGVEILRYHVHSNN